MLDVYPVRQGKLMRGRLTGCRSVMSFLAILLTSSCGGGGTVTISSSPPPPSPPPPPQSITVTTNRVFDQVSMQAPVAMMQAPADPSRWFLIEQRGVVRVFPIMVIFAQTTENPNSVTGPEISGLTVLLGWTPRNRDKIKNTLSFNKLCSVETGTTRGFRSLIYANMHQ